MRAKTGTRQHTLTYAAHAPPGTSAEHRACFTPKRSLVRTQYRPLPKHLVRDLLATIRAQVREAIGAGIALKDDASDLPVVRTAFDTWDKRNEILLERAFEKTGWLDSTQGRVRQCARL